MRDDLIHVLIVDGDDERRNQHIEALRDFARLDIHGAATVAGAGTFIEQDDVDCVVSQRRLADGIALDVFRKAAEQKAEVGSIIIATSDEKPLLLEGTTLIDGYIDLDDAEQYAGLAALIEDGYDNNSFATYPVPDDEQDRLDVLDEYREHVTEHLEALVEQAAHEFGVDKASIRFIGRETQEYVATYGFMAGEVERRQSICKHTILNDELTIINNVQDDPRFADNDLLVSMNIDWYAGAVISIKGENIGTFCLEDDEQQTLTAEEKQRLKEYASQASVLLGLEHEMQNDDITTIAAAVDAIWQYEA